MSIPEITAFIVVLTASLFLIGLAAATLFSASSAVRFLERFASTARAHYAEMAIRLVVGAAVITISESMLFSTFYYVFGWVLVVTSVGLLLLPWRLHQQFASTVVPPLTRHVWIFGLLALPLGGVTMFALMSGVFA